MAANPQQGAGTGLDQAAAEIEAYLNAAEPEETEAQEVEEETVEVEAEAEETETEANTDEAENDSEESEEQAALETLEQVAEALQVPLPDLLKSLRHKVKVDGDAFDVTLEELTNGYQKNSDYRQKTNALKRDREAWEAQRQEAAKAIEAEHAQNAYVLNSMEQALVQGMGSDEMAALKQSNPQAWLTKRVEFQDQLQRIQGMKQEASNRYQALREQSQREQQEQLARVIEREKEALADALPDWGDARRGALNDYLGKTYGFSPQEIGQVYDHRLVVMANKAMLYDQQQADTKETVKKVKHAPKLVRPSAPKSPGTVKANELRKLRGRLKSSGKIEDAAALILKSGYIK